jgi:hypothetical protein
MSFCCREPVRTPPGGDGVAAGDDVLQVLLQVGEDRLEERDLLLEAGQRRRWIMVDQAGVAEFADRRQDGRTKRELEARDDLDGAGTRPPALCFRRC